MKAAFIVGVLLPLLTACESDADKYKRLDQELSVAQLEMKVLDRAHESGQPVCPDLTKLSTNAYSRACEARTDSLRTKIALLERDMNLFMHR